MLSVVLFVILVSILLRPQGLRNLCQLNSMCPLTQKGLRSITLPSEQEHPSFDHLGMTSVALTPYARTVRAGARTRYCTLLGTMIRA